jgi:glycosyltransferase involved in cell wall biosynthesis
LPSAPRVTIGIPTYDRDTYLAEAVQSCLTQDYTDLEVLVVVDGSVNPRIDEVLAGFDDSRLRVVRHEANKGIAAATTCAPRTASGARWRSSTASPTRASCTATRW